MGVFTHWPYTNIHEMNLDWILEEVKKAVEEWSRFHHDIEKDFNDLKNYVYDYFKNLDLTSEVAAKIDEMYENGDFDDILERIIGDFTYDQPELFTNYTTLAQYYEELDNLTNTSEWIQSITIGSSVMGNPIKCYVIGKPKNGNQVFRNGLIFGGMHAREYQNTFVLANAIKTLVYNLDNDKGAIFGTPLKDMFTGYKLFIVPCDNPDGYKLCVEDYYSELPEVKKTDLANMVTDFIRGGFVDNNDFTPEELEEIIAEFGSLDNYQFREKDLPHVWNANIDGVDLHYNSYNANMKDYVLAYSRANNFPQTNAPRNFVGSDGYICPENQAIKTLLDSYEISSVLDLHQRGPTMFFQYKYGGQKFERNYFISQQIANATQTPVSRVNNGRVGFMGWFYEVYTGADYYGAIKETGWSRVDILVVII